MHNIPTQRGDYLKRAYVPLLIFVLIFTSVPTFFEVYRITLFNTISYDDYSRYLLLLLDNPEGKLPTSPSAYRIGSVFLAVPFYYLPAIEFSDAMGAGPVTLPPAKIAATQAICLANVVSVGLAAFLASRFLVERLGLDPLYGILSAFVFVSLSSYMSLQGVDGIAVFYFTLIVLSFLRRRVVLTFLLVALSALVNEKLLVLSIALFGGRLLLSPPRTRDTKLAFAASVLALGLYLTIISLWSIPGNENQKDPGSYLPALLAMAKLSASLKGAYLILWPIAISVALWALAVAGDRQRQVVQVADIGVIIAITAVAFAVNVEFGVGRIVLHAYPLFVLGAVVGLSQLRGGPPDPSHGRISD